MVENKIKDSLFIVLAKGKRRKDKQVTNTENPHKLVNLISVPCHKRAIPVLGRIWYGTGNIVDATIKYSTDIPCT